MPHFPPPRRSRSGSHRAVPPSLRPSPFGRVGVKDEEIPQAPPSSPAPAASPPPAALPVASTAQQPPSPAPSPVAAPSSPPAAASTSPAPNQTAPTSTPTSTPAQSRITASWMPQWNSEPPISLSRQEVEDAHGGSVPDSFINWFVLNQHPLSQLLRNSENDNNRFAQRVATLFGSNLIQQGMDIDSVRQIQDTIFDWALDEAELLKEEEKQRTVTPTTQEGWSEELFGQPLAGRELLHRATPLLGVAALPGAQVVLQYASTIGLDFSIKHPDLVSADRRLYVSRATGRKIIYNEILRTRYPGQGLGSRLLAAQVEQARQHGFIIQTLGLDYVDGAGEHSMRGASFWPRVGYNAPLRDITRTKLYDKIREHYPEAQTLQDLMYSPGGTEAWKQWVFEELNGVGDKIGIDLIFDPNDEKAVALLTNYNLRKQQKLAGQGKSFQVKEADLAAHYEDPGASPEDDDLLVQAAQQAQQQFGAFGSKSFRPTEYTPALYRSYDTASLPRGELDDEELHNSNSHGNLFGTAQVTSHKKPPQESLESYDFDSPEHRVKELETPHKFSSTQFDLDQAGYPRSQGSPVAKLKEIQNNIQDSDLAEDGKEDNFHVTVLYGLHGDNPKEVEHVLRHWLMDREHTSLQAQLGEVSLFPANEQNSQRGGAYYDVVKVDVDSDDLHSLHNFLAQHLQHTDTFPEYHPHVTLAYVKPGLGWLYVGEDLNGHIIHLNKFVFSDKHGQKTIIDLSKLKTCPQCGHKIKALDNEPGWRCSQPPCEWSLFAAGDTDMDMEAHPQPPISNQEPWERAHRDRKEEEVRDYSKGMNYRVKAEDEPKEPKETQRPKEPKEPQRAAASPAGQSPNPLPAALPEEPGEVHSPSLTWGGQDTETNQQPIEEPQDIIDQPLDLKLERQQDRVQSYLRPFAQHKVNEEQLPQEIRDQPLYYNFVQAISENPQDEANWLVLADWLEEEGSDRIAYNIRTSEYISTQAAQQVRWDLLSGNHNDEQLMIAEGLVLDEVHSILPLSIQERGLYLIQLAGEIFKHYQAGSNSDILQWPEGWSSERFNRNMYQGLAALKMDMLGLASDEKLEEVDRNLYEASHIVYRYVTNPENRNNNYDSTEVRSAYESISILGRLAGNLYHMQPLDRISSLFKEDVFREYLWAIVLAAAGEESVSASAAAPTCSAALSLARGYAQAAQPFVQGKSLPKGYRIKGIGGLGLGNGFTFYRQAFDRWRTKPNVLGERRLILAYRRHKPADELAMQNDEEFRMKKESTQPTQSEHKRPKNTCPDGSKRPPGTGSCQGREGGWDGRGDNEQSLSPEENWYPGDMPAGVPPEAKAFRCPDGSPRPHSQATCAGREGWVPWTEEERLQNTLSEPPKGPRAEQENIHAKYPNAPRVTPSPFGRKSLDKKSASQRAVAADLVTLPKDIEGTNCKNCQFLAKDQKDYCQHPDLMLHLWDGAEHMTCSLWDAEGVKHPDAKQGKKSLPVLDANELARAQKADLITLPKDVENTSCRNCEYQQDKYCHNPKVDQPVTPRNCCNYWDADGVKRAWEQQGSKAFDRPLYMPPRYLLHPEQDTYRSIEGTDLYSHQDFGKSLHCRIKDEGTEKAMSWLGSGSGGDLAAPPAWGGPKAEEKLHKAFSSLQQVKALPPLSHGHQPTLAVDLDGTLADTPAHAGAMDLDLVHPRPGAIEAMTHFHKLGWRIIIWTCRDDIKGIEKWLKQHNIPWDFINENPDQPTDSPKIIADYYLDDRSIRPDDWQQAQAEIEQAAEARQPVGADANYETLKALGEESLPLLEDIMEKLGLPILQLDQTAPNELEGRLQQSGPLVLLAPLKAQERAEQKVESDYGGDWSRLLDMVRAAVAVDTFDEMKAAIRKLESLASYARKPKNRFKKPLANGYRDYLINYKLPNGFICEVQFHLKPILAAREKEKLAYDIVRAIRAALQEEGRSSMTSGEVAAMQRSRATSQRLFEEAWQHALAQQPKDSKKKHKKSLTVPRVKSSPFGRVFSKAGYTGIFRDRLGRRTCYAAGRKVPCNPYNNNAADDRNKPSPRPPEFDQPIGPPTGAAAGRPKHPTLEGTGGRGVPNYYGIIFNQQGQLLIQPWNDLLGGFIWAAPSPPNERPVAGLLQEVQQATDAVPRQIGEIGEPDQRNGYYLLKVENAGDQPQQWSTPQEVEEQLQQLRDPAWQKRGLDILHAAVQQWQQSQRRHKSLIAPSPFGKKAQPTLTGPIQDSRGRRMCFRDGKHAPCEEFGGKGEGWQQQRATEDLYDAARRLVSKSKTGDANGQNELLSMLAATSPEELASLKRDHHLYATPASKEELKKQVIDKLSKLGYEVEEGQTQEANPLG